jgi:uncharacterized membrane protein
MMNCGEMMGNGGGMMMIAMGVVWLLIVILLLLGIAGLVKYLRSGSSKRPHEDR